MSTEPPKIFILNLDRATQRRNTMLDRLATLGLDAEFISAVDGRELNATDLPHGTEPLLSPGEIGCYLSHVNFWRTVIRRKLPYAVVLEDDVILKPDFIHVIEKITTLNMPFDAVRLSALLPIRGITVASLPGNLHLVLPKKPPSGTQGYLVSINGAKRLLSKLAVPKQPIDVALDRYWKYGLCIPVVCPSVVEEDRALESTIVHRIRDTHRETALRRISHLANKRWRKIAVFFMARRLRKYGLMDCP